MKFYLFQIYDEPKQGRYFRYGIVKEVVCTNGDVFAEKHAKDSKTGRPLWKENSHLIEKFFIETHYQKRTTEPFPNFLQIRFTLECADERALAFLDSHNILYKKIPAEIINETDRKYAAVIFEEKTGLLDLEKSNLYLNERGFANTNNREFFSPGESQIVLNNSTLSLKGIYSIKELGSLICDQGTKQELESSGLTGFRLEELQVSK